jgi:predicted metal-dependent phosphoesterase TrpH
MDVLKFVTLSSITLLLGLQSAGGFAHDTAYAPKSSNQRAIEFPDTNKYKTLAVDLHIHSVFSDGHVWPNIRVAEAQQDGLDAIAMTEHLEWQPHLADIPHPDRNRSYQEAAESAKGSDLIVLSGSEITRYLPAGHINAIFINDANKLINVEGAAKNSTDTEVFGKAAIKWPAQEAVEAAHKQGAFMFWNHPNWSNRETSGITKINTFHAKNAAEGKLHGIEVANTHWYAEAAFQTALDYDLALIGTSDVHDLIDWDYLPHEGGHRPVTLVFAKEKTADSIKEALFARRTAVWFKNLLIGREKDLGPLLASSIKVKSMKYQTDTVIAEIRIENTSDANFDARYTGPYSLGLSSDRFQLPAHSITVIEVKPGKRLETLELPITLENTLVTPETHATMVLKAALK